MFFQYPSSHKSPKNPISPKSKKNLINEKTFQSDNIFKVI